MRPNILTIFTDFQSYRFYPNLSHFLVNISLTFYLKNYHHYNFTNHLISYLTGLPLDGNKNKLGQQQQQQQQQGQMDAYRLPIGKRPANPVQSSSSSSIVSSLQRLPWFNSKGSSPSSLPENLAASASSNDQSVSFASLFDQTPSPSNTNSQQSTRRIPFLSQISKFFSSASFPRPSNIFPQITAKSSLNYPSPYDQLSAINSGYSNFFQNNGNYHHLITT